MTKIVPHCGQNAGNPGRNAGKHMDSRSCWCKTATSIMLAAMPPNVRICHICEERLAKASNAIRRHARAMHNALDFVRAGISEEEIDQNKVELISSFHDAKAAWDAYQTHLKEHGVFPVIATSTHL